MGYSPRRRHRGSDSVALLTSPYRVPHRGFRPTSGEVDRQQRHAAEKTSTISIRRRQFSNRFCFSKKAIMTPFRHLVCCVAWRSISAFCNAFVQTSSRPAAAGRGGRRQHPGVWDNTGLVRHLASHSLQDQMRLDEEEALYDDDRYSNLPVGVPDSFRIVKQYHTEPTASFSWNSLPLEPSDVERLDLTPQNISLPVALMLHDPTEYPTLSRARKACRKGNIIIHRGPSSTDNNSTDQFRGRVGDRIFPGDLIGKQVRIGSGYSPVLGYRKPAFELPVVFEDDHCALVNKPSGVVVYSQGNGGHGTMTVRAALPFVLEPPKRGTYAVMRRPASVHRLDKPTSGLLCIAKTKPAMLHLSRQFHDRIIQKTYFAVVNGIPPERKETAITAREAFELGVDVDPNNETGGWHLINSKQDGREAVTVWRAVRYAKSLRAHDGYLTMVELKPKTGRYHQLRRHMAWECGCPLVGDEIYDEGTASAMSFRDRGLFLCSTRIILEHPFYNDPNTMHLWKDEHSDKFEQCSFLRSDKGHLMMAAEVSLPIKFENLLNHEEARYNKLIGKSNLTDVPPLPMPSVY